MRGVFRISCLLATLPLAACAPEPDAARPDVLLVVMDTVRADFLSSYGHPRPTSIQLESIAEAGVLFEDVTASGPWTWPSHASLFTGEPPWVHGARIAAAREGTAQLDGTRVTRLRRDLPTLAERFAAVGYRTAALAANDWLSPELGLMRGFETTEILEDDAEVIEAARREIARGDRRPFFLFVNLMSAHAPYREGPGPWALGDPAFLAPETAPDWVRPYLTEDGPGVHLAAGVGPDGITGVTRVHTGELRIPADGIAALARLYEAGVRAADFSLGRVVSAWVAARPEGVVAVTSDHGEAFGEHGLVDHLSSVYPEVLRVPLVLAAPGLLPKGERVSTPVEMRDLHPTLLELAGIDTPARSLVATASGAARDEPVLAAAWPSPVWARLAGGRFASRWLLHRRAGWALVFSSDGASELYDLSADPGMTRDLATREPERVAALRAEGERVIAASPAPDAEALDVPTETAARLRRLGYAAD